MPTGKFKKLSSADELTPVSRFSVVISCYNQVAFICEAVDSALAQRLPAKEIIVVDDGSTDGSLPFLRQYGERISLVALGENRGANAARNIGAAKATGDYLVFLDGDDVMMPWALEVYENIASLSQPKVILSSLKFFSGPCADEREEDPTQVQYCEYHALIKKDRSYRASASAIVVNRETFFDVGGWTETIFPMEDLDLIVKLGYSGRTVQILSPPTKYYRVHSGNTVGQVRRCVGMLQTVIQRAKQGVYLADKRKSSLSCYAFIGGPAWFWVKKSFRAGFYRESFLLFASSWPMICASAGQRFSQVLKGKKGIQSGEIIPARSNAMR